MCPFSFFLSKNPYSRYHLVSPSSSLSLPPLPLSSIFTPFVKSSVTSLSSLPLCILQPPCIPPSFLLFLHLSLHRSLTWMQLIWFSFLSSFFSLLSCLSSLASARLSIHSSLSSHFSSTVHWYCQCRNLLQNNHSPSNLSSCPFIKYLSFSANVVSQMYIHVYRAYAPVFQTNWISSEPPCKKCALALAQTCNAYSRHFQNTKFNTEL